MKPEWEDFSLLAQDFLIQLQGGKMGVPSMEDLQLAGELHALLEKIGAVAGLWHL